MKLVGNGGEEQFVPLTIRDDASHGRLRVPEQRHDLAGLQPLGQLQPLLRPDGPGGQDFANRARVVSFDRPYPQTWASGAADFVGNELPLLFHLESLGLDLTYWTDVDLHARPAAPGQPPLPLQPGARRVLVPPMRQAAADANADGVNLAFLGANACYRQIRLEPTSVGPNRLQVCYKDAAEDPLANEDSRR